MIFTHCGKLGDFGLFLPLASGFYKNTGEKIHWVLPKRFKPFTKIESLLLLQEFTDKVTLVDYVVENYGQGGQPYKFNPADYSVAGEYKNLGFSSNFGIMEAEDYLCNIFAKDFNLPFDDKFVLNIPEADAVNKNFYTEPYLETKKNEDDAVFLDPQKDILDNLVLAKRCQSVTCHSSGFAVLMTFAGKFFNLAAQSPRMNHAFFNHPCDKFLLIE